MGFYEVLVFFRDIGAFPNFFNLVELEGCDIVIYFSFFDDFSSYLISCYVFLFFNKV